MKASKTLNVQEPVARATVWNALCALAVGGLLGSAVMLCSLWIQDALWCTALQSAGTALVLVIPIHLGSRKWIVYSVEGDVLAFCQWMQRCGSSNPI